MALTEAEAQAAVRYGHEVGHLKLSRRTGWWRAGIRDGESVAEHSWRTALLAYIIAAAEGANPDRAAAIGVFHDTPETRTGDIEYVGRRYVTATDDEKITADQVSGLPTRAAEGITSLIHDMENGTSLEAQCAHDADKLECLLQAIEYQRQGHTDVAEWIRSMAAAVRTTTGKALAETALTADPAQWWRDITNQHNPA